MHSQVDVRIQIFICVYIHIHICITCTCAYSASRLRDVRWRDTRSTHTHTLTYMHIYPYTHKAPILISLAPAQRIPPALSNTCMHTQTVQTHTCKHTNTYLLRCHRRWCARVRLELQRYIWVHIGRGVLIYPGKFCEYVEFLWYIRGICMKIYRVERTILAAIYIILYIFTYLSVFMCIQHMKYSALSYENVTCCMHDTRSNINYMIHAFMYTCICIYKHICILCLFMCLIASIMTWCISLQESCAQ